MFGRYRYFSLFGAITIAVWLMVSCKEGEELEESTQMPSEEQALLKVALTEAGIKYRIDSSGAIWYPLSDEMQVGKLQQDILARTRPLHAVSFSTQAESDSFMNDLKNNGVTARQWKDFDKYWVQWPESDDIKVDQILGAINRRRIREQLDANNQ